MAVKRVLVVDDDPEFLTEVCDTLSSHGFEPITVADGSAVQEAVRLMKPEVILLDVKMPGMTGYQVKDRLSQDIETMRVPVIAITGSYNDSDQRYLTHTLGVCRCIMKPFMPQELISAIELILTGAAGRLCA